MGQLRQLLSYLSLGLVLLLGLGACEYTEMLQEDDSEGATLQVLATTAGFETDSDGYTVSVSGQADKHLDPDGAVQYRGLSEGTYTVTLSGISDNCRVPKDNPQKTDISGEETVSFLVKCVPQYGSNSWIVFQTDSLQGGWDGSSDRTIFDQRIYAMRPDGSELHKVRDESNTAYVEPKLSPNGNRIAFYRKYCENVEATEDSREVSGCEAGMYTMTVQGNELIKVGEGYFSEPAWSPSGDKIAYGWGDDIHVVASDGSGRLDRIKPNFEGDCNLAAIDWSADGESFVLECGAVYRVDRYSGETVRLSDTGMMSEAPNWHPERNDILYHSKNADGRAYNVFSVNPLTGDTEQITRRGNDQTIVDNAKEPVWAPSKDSVFAFRLRVDHEPPPGGKNSRAIVISDMSAETQLQVVQIPGIREIDWK